MAKFIMVENLNELKKIKLYIKNNQMCKFYFTPKLFNELISSKNIKFTMNLGMDVIKITETSNLDLMCTSVYNKVYQNDAIRIDAININGVLCQLAKNIENDSAIFGLEGENEEYYCFEYEQL